MESIDQARRTRLTELAEALAPLHRLLIDEACRGYERERGKIPGRVALVRLLLEDPFFSWLRPLSILMTHIDELLDRKEALEPGEIGAVRVRLESLIAGGERAGGFAGRYIDVLQHNVEVIMAHAAVRRALAGL